MLLLLVFAGPHHRTADPRFGFDEPLMRSGIGHLRAATTKTVLIEGAKQLRACVRAYVRAIGWSAGGDAGADG